jgi:integrase
LTSSWLAAARTGETENGDGRNFPVTQELRAVLEEQVSKVRALELATGQIIQWLFHRNGEPIKNFRRAWLSACKLAGVPGRLRHDFRRAACRNLERMHLALGCDEDGWPQTESIYRRYAIADGGTEGSGGQNRWLPRSGTNVQ